MSNEFTVTEIYQHAKSGWQLLDFTFSKGAGYARDCAWQYERHSLRRVLILATPGMWRIEAPYRRYASVKAKHGHVPRLYTLRGWHSSPGLTHIEQKVRFTYSCIKK